MTSNELCDALKITRRILSAWIKKGMPHDRQGRRYEFDHEQVRVWLLKNGLAREENVVANLSDVANHFGVSTRTVGYWRDKGMPGEPGYFHLDAITQWRSEQGHPAVATSPASGVRNELLEIEKETKALRLAELRGELVPLDPVCRAMVRFCSEAKAILQQLPDQLLAALPRKTTAKLRRSIRGECIRTVDAALQTLADLVRSGELAGSDRLTRSQRLQLIAAAIHDQRPEQQRATLVAAIDEAPEETP